MANFFCRQARLCAILLLLWANLGSLCLASSSQHEHPIVHPRNVSGSASTAATASSFSLKFLDAVNANPGSTSGSAPLLAKATEADIARARKIVREAQEKAGVLNLARINNPRRNRYKLKPGTIVGGGPTIHQRDEDELKADDGDAPPPPLLHVTEEMAAAAALVAEADAAASTSNAPIQKRADFWMEGLARKGTVPWGKDPKYQVFRNVKDFGARGDGKTDDTAAIMNAINSTGQRCAENCNGSTLKNAIIYFPQGTYLVSKTIYALFGTQMIGNANAWPTIKASTSFEGLGVVSTDEYTGGGKGIDGLSMEWYVNTANFYRQIRNFYIDVTDAPQGRAIAGIHYQVAQATSLQNIEIVAKGDQYGMYSENGSGGLITDVTFRGGKFGFWGGNQQFTARRLTFIGCETAAKIIWDWGWVWKTITVRDGDVGFNLARQRGEGYIGSSNFMDSIFQNVKKAIVVSAPDSEPGKGITGLVLENVAFKSCDMAVADAKGNRLLASGDYEHWAMGPVYKGENSTREYSSGKSYKMDRVSELLDTRNNGLPFRPYFERSKPQYEARTVSDFVHLKDLGAKGDGVTDDTAAVQKAFDANPNGVKIIFVDAGTYILTDTVTVPKNAKIVGEAWSQFAARGPKFGNPSEPRVMFKVGNEGDMGSVEMQDLLFTTKGATPGVVLIEWNVKAVEKGFAGLWDCHVRIGGATGTDLNPAECPAVVDAPSPKCQAASMMMHITPKASGYFENMWLWVADHIIDDEDMKDANNTMTQVSVYVARGLLVESRSAVWLYGTSSEHAVMYQYSFYGASNVFAGMVQTESPYYQPQPKPPAPFDKVVNVFNGDPNYRGCSGSNVSEFGGCDSSWGVMIQSSTDLYIASAGIYSWFDKYTQDCIDKHACQNALVYLDGNFDRVRFAHLVTIGSKYMIVSNKKKGILATDNLAITSHPRWSQISIFDVPSLGKMPKDLFEDEEDTPPSACTDKYETVDDVLAKVDRIPNDCRNIYALGALGRTLAKTLNNFTDLENGYQKKFDAYTRYIKELVPTQLEEFMAWNNGPGNKYFTCTINLGDSNRNASTGKCPLSQYKLRDLDFFTLYYHLDDEAGFFKELLEKKGIDKPWVKFGDTTESWTCRGNRTGDCSPFRRTKRGFPLGADSYTIPDPKDMVKAALPGVADLGYQIGNAESQMQLGMWGGVGGDAVSVMSMPVSMLQQAVENMAQIRAIGDKVLDQERMSLIFTILSIVFMVIPFVGQALAAETAIFLQIAGRIIALIGAAGNAGLAVYDIIQDPLMAPMAILASLAGGVGRGGRDVKKLADAKRSMKADDIKKLGEIFKKNDNVVQNLVTYCKRKT